MSSPNDIEILQQAHGLLLGDIIAILKTQFPEATDDRLRRARRDFQASRTNAPTSLESLAREAHVHLLEIHLGRLPQQGEMPK